MVAVYSDRVPLPTATNQARRQRQGVVLSSSDASTSSRNGKTPTSKISIFEKLFPSSSLSFVAVDLDADKLVHTPPWI